MQHTATYSPEDNKLRLYPAARLDRDLYERVRAAGFIWAPKQEIFVAPMWTPARADLLQELCGEIGDEDTSLCERAEERAERFEDYSDARASDANQAHKAVAAIADNIPLGQPILVGHHSERHARKDAERIENGMRRAVKMWETSKYWTERARGAIRAAKYKERPDVRARRIKGLESDLRKQKKERDGAAQRLRLWSLLDNDALTTLRRKDGTAGTFYERALVVANLYDSWASRCYPLAEFPRNPPASQYEGMMGLWSALGGDEGEAAAIIRPAQAQAMRLDALPKLIAHCERWIAHIENRLAYERAMLGESGGTEADKNAPMKGGGCKCWASPRGGWSYIQKVNKVSVTVLDNWGNGGGNFTRTIPFDKLAAIMSPVEVEMQRESGQLVDTDDKTGFYLAAAPPVSKAPAPIIEDTICPDGPTCPGKDCIEERAKAGLDSRAFEGMRETLRNGGVQVVSAPQLFPTPRELAQRVADLADVQPGQRVLEPSAGTGALLGALGGRMFGHNPECGEVVAVEINHALAERLRSEFPLTDVRCADFLRCNGDLGAFDRIVMNPPFQDAADIAHIRHAVTMLKPGGRLVAICAHGPRQIETLRPLAESSGGIFEPLPAGTFKESGTGVNTALLVIEA